MPGAWRCLLLPPATKPAQNVIPALIGNVAHIGHIERLRQIAQHITDRLPGLVALMPRQDVHLPDMRLRENAPGLLGRLLAASDTNALLKGGYLGHHTRKLLFY